MDTNSHAYLVIYSSVIFPLKSMKENAYIVVLTEFIFYLIHQLRDQVLGFLFFGYRNKKGLGLFVKKKSEKEP